jgi:hypothetical protein
MSKPEEKNIFVCAVCYCENENDSGLVKPLSCMHKICIECFSRIMMEHKEDSKCPECRAHYLDQSEVKENKNEHDVDNYDGSAASATMNNAANNSLINNINNENQIYFSTLAYWNYNNNNLNNVNNNNNLNLNNIANYYEIDNYYYVEDRNGNLFITLH